NWICDNVTAGDVLEVLRPSGTSTPASLDDALLRVAGRSGSTPAMSILKSCLAGGSGKTALLYANRDEQWVSCADERRELTERHPDRLAVIHLLQSVQGLPTPARVRSLARPFTGREAFVCGPEIFMDLVTGAL